MYRVSRFLSSRPNWILWFIGGRSTLSCRRGGGGNSDDGEKAWNSGGSIIPLRWRCLCPHFFTSNPTATPPPPAYTDNKWGQCIWFSVVFTPPPPHVKTEKAGGLSPGSDEWFSPFSLSEPLVERRSSERRAKREIQKMNAWALAILGKNWVESG